MLAPTLTFLLTTVAAASTAVVHPRETTGGQDILAEIKGWKDTSDCSLNDFDLDFNIPKEALNSCVILPFATATIELGALSNGSYQVSFYTDDGCTDDARRATVNVAGNCLSNDNGPWYGIKVTTYTA